MKQLQLARGIIPLATCVGRLELQPLKERVEPARSSSQSHDWLSMQRPLAGRKGLTSLPRI